MINAYEGREEGLVNCKGMSDGEGYTYLNIEL
jgi:hypothetical protein